MISSKSSRMLSLKGGILLCIIFVVGTEIMYLDKKNNNRYAITTSVASIIFTLGIMTGSIMATAPVAQTTTSAATTTTTTPPEAAPSSSALELSPQPVYQEQVSDAGQTPINQTHIQLSFTGNGTLNLPNGTEPIRTTSTGSGIASIIGTFTGKEVLTTEDGSESATATFYEIVRFGDQDARGIAIALFETNSTGMLAPLNGMIMVGVDELLQDGNSVVTLWEWQSGIPLPIAITTTPPLEELPPLMDGTATTTTE
jgi:hypothetical protein